MLRSKVFLGLLLSLVVFRSINNASAQVFTYEIDPDKSIITGAAFVATFIPTTPQEGIAANQTKVSGKLRLQYDFNAKTVKLLDSNFTALNSGNYYPGTGSTLVKAPAAFGFFGDLRKHPTSPVNYNAYLSINNFSFSLNSPVLPLLGASTFTATSGGAYFDASQITGDVKSGDINMIWVDNNGFSIKNSDNFNQLPPPAPQFQITSKNGASYPTLSNSLGRPVALVPTVS